MEEEASRINLEQTLEGDSLPSGQSGEGRHDKDQSGKDSKEYR